MNLPRFRGGLERAMHYIDYHIHSKYSIDGYETIDTICETAIAKGIREIAITDHYDPFAEDVYCEKTYPAKEIKQGILLAQEKYKDSIKLLYGVEAGQAQLYPHSVKNLLQNEYDYVIGSLHNIQGDEDLALVRFTEKSKTHYFDCYFNELLQMVKFGLFDCLGHLDYPKRYAANAGLEFVESDYMEIVESILKEIIHQGRGIELNCSGLRSSLAESMPSFEVLKLYREMGGEIITIGSDAHHAKDIGEKLAKGYEMIENAGFRYITTFEKRKPAFIKLTEVLQ